MYVVCKTQEDNIIKAFRFQNFWCNHTDFCSVVRNWWKMDFVGDPFLELHAKLKSVKRGLRKWSKKEYGNIFVKKATMEDILGANEKQFELDPTSENRAQLY